MKKTLTTALAAAIVMTAAVAAARDLRLADFQPPTHFIVDDVYKPFADAVSAGTNGDVSVSVFMGGELGQGAGGAIQPRRRWRCRHCLRAARLHCIGLSKEPC